MAVVGRDMEAIKMSYALWYYDMDRKGSIKAWAQEHDVHPDTCYEWNSEDWFLAIGREWKKRLSDNFGLLMHAAFKRALDTDSFNNQQISAARFVAEMIGEMPDKKVKVEVDVYTWLKSLPAEEEPDEGVFEALPDGQS